MNTTFEEIFNPEMISSLQEDGLSNKLNDLVYNCMESAILSLKLQPGEKLNVAEIARNFGVSITPVKNSIQKLIQNGLVVERPGYNGLYVFDLDDKSLADIFGVRQCIEGFAAYECARRLPIIELEPLRKLADDFYDSWMTYADGCETAEGRLLRNSYDISFHELMVKDAGNDFLLDAYKRSNYRASYVQIRTFDYWDVDTNMDFRRICAGQHRNIVNAISTGIPEIARKAAEDHAIFAASRTALYKTASKGLHIANINE